MILSAMMFTLGVLVSGLAWLAFSVALVRRTRWLTERRLLASISVSRTEFVTERDELRARHAVDMHRLEREVSRVLDMATAYRLESDVKEMDLVSVQAELAAREEDFKDLQGRLEHEQQLNQGLERRSAEAGSALRSAQHALKLETARRAAAEDALQDAGAMTDQRRTALAGLRAENDALRDAIDDDAGEASVIRLPRILMPSAQQAAQKALAAAAEERDGQSGGSVVALPTRPRPGASEPPEHSVALVSEAARDLQRLAGEAHGDLTKGVWRASAHADPRMPVATAPGETSVADLQARRMAATPVAENDDHANSPGPDDKPETRFFEALAEIRALKRSASQAGE